MFQKWTNIVVALVLVAVHCSTASADGIVDSVKCLGDHAHIVLADSGDLAQEWNTDGHVVNVTKQGVSAVGSCGVSVPVSPTIAQLTFDAFYTGCGSSPVTIHSGNGNKVEWVEIKFRATVVATGDYWDFTVNCEYSSSTTTGGNGTVINGGGHHEPSGNNTGNASSSLVNATNTLQPITPESSEQKTVYSANFNTTLYYNLVLNDTTAYYAILPETCFFSDNSNGSSDTAHVISFIDEGCPVNTARSPLSIVDDWVAETKSDFYVKWQSFKYGDGDSSIIYIHCVVYLCIDHTRCNAKNMNCSTPWTISGDYNSSADQDFTWRDHSGWERHVISAMAHQNSYVKKDNSMHVGGKSGGATVLFIVAGILGFLFIISLIIVGVLMARKRDTVLVEKQNANDVRWISPFRLPRTKLDRSTLPAAQGASEGSIPRPSIASSVRSQSSRAPSVASSRGVPHSFTQSAIQHVSDGSEHSYRQARSLY